jgi:type I restriction enzyme, S subunit
VKPSGWDESELSRVAIIEREVAEPVDIPDGVTYVGLEHITSDGSFLDPKPVRRGDVASSKFRFTSRHILYGKLRPYLTKIALPSFDGVCSTDILPILPGPRIDRAFLYHFLRHPVMVAYANARTSGANLPRLSPSELERFVIPLPPLPEQRRIADVLDRAETLRAKRRASVARVKIIRRGVFNTIFGDPATNPRRWDVKPLDELMTDFHYGTSAKSGPQGKPALRIPNVIGGVVDVTELKTVDVDPASFQRLQLVEGDLLFVRTNGNPDFVGRCAVFTKAQVAGSGFDADNFIFASYLIRGRPRLDLVSPVFLREFLLGREGRRRLRSRARTSAGQFNINTKGLGSIPVPVPPLPLQNEFARRVSALERIESTYGISLSHLDSLFSSLQHRAFRGEL